MLCHLKWKVGRSCWGKVNAQNYLTKSVNRVFHRVYTHLCLKYWMIFKNTLKSPPKIKPGGISEIKDWKKLKLKLIFIGST